MTDSHTMHYLPGPYETRRMTTEELRAAFLVRGLFVPGAVTLRHVDLDRVVLGGVVPLGAPLELDPPASLGAEYFCERRELVGKQVRVERRRSWVLAASCEGDPECARRDTVDLIVSAEPLPAPR